MSYISNEGTYTVSATNAIINDWTKERVNDPEAFSVRLFLETADGLKTSYDLFYSHRKYMGGKNLGKTFAEVSEEVLKKLGSSRGLISLHDAIDKGLQVSVKMENEEYNGETRCKVKYINPVSKNGVDLKSIDINKLMEKFLGAKKEDDIVPDQVEQLPF